MMSKKLLILHPMTTTLIIGLLIPAMEMGGDSGKYVKDHFGMTPLEFRNN